MMYIPISLGMVVHLLLGFIDISNYVESIRIVAFTQNSNTYFYNQAGVVLHITNFSWPNMFVEQFLIIYNNGYFSYLTTKR